MLRLKRVLPPAAPRCGAVSTRFRRQGVCAWLLAVALACPSFEGRSDDLGTELRDYALHTWSKADGLPDGSVTVIQQTQDGYLWVGTAAGLARFDGIKFTAITLPAEKPNRPVAITALCEDAAGEVWIGTE